MIMSLYCAKEKQLELGQPAKLLLALKNNFDRVKLVDSVSLIL